MKKVTPIITIIFMAITTAIVIIYDVWVLYSSSDATISHIYNKGIYNFPFLAYGWLGLAGHFFSIWEIKRQRIKELIIISLVVFAFSFLPVFGIIKISPVVIALIGLFGFLVGSICWGQNIKDKR
jgi:hypothetical protein